MSTPNSVPAAEAEKHIFPPSPTPKSRTGSEDNDKLLEDHTKFDIRNLLILFRFVNALCVRTFFQPDEYFQALEPAWQMAFGAGSGAWITWEWQHQLRTSLHPALFAALFWVADKPMEYLGFYPQFRGMVLAALPNAAQALCAAAGDYYTWQLAEKIYGPGSDYGMAALLMTIFSPWQWFCSTRTFSNCLETTLTIAALNYWPWGLTLDAASSAKKPITPSSVFHMSKSVKHLRISLLLALTACILRPTNSLIWLCLLAPSITPLLSTPRVPFSDYLIFLREVIFCSLAILALSFTSDYLYYSMLTFPPYQFLTYNVTLDLASFYGRNDWHYYLSQGLPLLLTTYLPFAVMGFRESVTEGKEGGKAAQALLTATVFTTIAVLSQVAHKEVRFIYPLLPLLHIISAPAIFNFFNTTTTQLKHAPPFPSTPTTTITTCLHRKPLLTLLLLANLSIAYYTTRVHQSGVLAVLPHLRHLYEDLALDNRGVPLSSPLAQLDTTVPLKTTDYVSGETFVAFLMPCHSTPWRAHLFYSDLKAWALTCEPPISIPAHTPERVAYRDEADRFFDDPVAFLKTEIGKERPWPRYVVGFQTIQPVIQEYYTSMWPGGEVKEVWRAFNSHWIDDPRRAGDVVIWEFGVSEGEEAREYVEMRPNLMA